MIIERIPRVLYKCKDGTYSTHNRKGACYNHCGLSRAKPVRLVRAGQTLPVVKTRQAVPASDLVLVPPGSIPITTSGKIRRAACVERYRQDEFKRLDVIGA